MNKTRVTIQFRYQAAVEQLEVWTDTGHAGCLQTRTATGGGVIMLGQHMVKSWSSTQPSVTMSSGEAEMVGVTRAAPAALGFRSLPADLGFHWPVRVWTDSTASIGMCSRQGLGKVRHLDVQLMWIQQRIRNHDLDLYKILGEENPADLMTKAGFPQDRADHLLRLMGCRFAEGRPETAPEFRREGGTKAFAVHRSKKPI